MGKLESVGQLESPVISAPSFAALAASEAVDAPKRKVAAGPVEPQMRGLVRILGDQVLDIFPPVLRDVVDELYRFHQEHPDSYQKTRFDSAEERDNTLAVIRAYGDCAPNGPYTIRTLADNDPRMLVWRPQDRRGSRKGAETSEASE